MDEQETTDRNEKERRYAVTQDDIRIIRKELNVLTGQVGKLFTANEQLLMAIRGDASMGHEGMIKRVESFKDDLDSMRLQIIEIKDEVGDLHVKTDKKVSQSGIIISLGSIFLGVIIKWLMDYLTAGKK